MFVSIRYINAAFLFADDNDTSIHLFNMKNGHRSFSSILLPSNRIPVILSKEKKVFNEKEINLLIKKRNEARKNKDFDLADNIRKELIEMGIEIKDQSNETIWKKV